MCFKIIILDKSGYGLLLTFVLMPGNEKTSNYHAGCRKKQNKKRQATSRLIDNGPSDLNSSENPNNNREQKRGKSKQSKKHKQECTPRNTQTTATIRLISVIKLWHSNSSSSRDSVVCSSPRLYKHLPRHSLMVRSGSNLPLPHPPVLQNCLKI